MEEEGSQRDIMYVIDGILGWKNKNEKQNTTKDGIKYKLAVTVSRWGGIILGCCSLIELFPIWKSRSL